MKELGNRLRLAREQLGISIEELSSATRIEPKYLFALERGNFDALPGATYIRSYLRTYAIYVNLDPRQVISFYQKQQTLSQAPLSRTTRVQRVMEEQENVNSSIPRNQKQEFSRTSGKMVTMSRTEIKQKTKPKRKKDSGFARFYNGLLIVGFLLLVVAAGIVIYLRVSSKEVAELSDKGVPLTATVTHAMLEPNL